MAMNDKGFMKDIMYRGIDTDGKPEGSQFGE